MSLEELKEALFYLDMKDRWTAEDFEYADELRKKIRELEKARLDKEVK